jgi:hypothetical protein
MNVEIGTKVAQFPEKEYINGIFVAVHANKSSFCVAVKSSATCLSGGWGDLPIPTSKALSSLLIIVLW